MHTCTCTYIHNTHTSHIHNAHNTHNTHNTHTSHTHTHTTHNTHNTHTSQMHNTQHTSHRAEHSNTFLSGGMEEFIFRFGKFLTIEDLLDCFESKLVIGREFGTSVDTRWYLWYLCTVSLCLICLLWVNTFPLFHPQVHHWNCHFLNVPRLVSIIYDMLGTMYGFLV